MAEVTVEQLAKTVGTDAAKLLSQMKDAGLPHKKADETVSDDDKRTLLSHLKRSHGSDEEAPRKITLKRKSVSTLKTGGSSGKRTVNVEVRKKRTYVKRPEIEETAELESVESEAVADAEVTATPEPITPVVEEPTPDPEPIVEEPVVEEVAAEPEVEIQPEPEPEEDPRNLDPEVLRQRAAARRRAEEEERQRKMDEAVAKRKADEERKKAEQEAAQKAATAEKVAATQADKRPKRLHDAPKPAGGRDNDDSRRGKPGRGRLDRSNMSGARGKQRGHNLSLSDIEAAESGRGRGRGGKRRRSGDDQNQHAFEQPTEKIVYDVELPENISVGDLSQQMAVKAGVVIKELMKLGVMATINQMVDQDTASLVVEELGHRIKLKSDDELEERLEETMANHEGTPELRAPVVTVMGHVDHGKTSLLDYIRSSRVAVGEAGGITQHIGAYHVKTDMGMITFLDTPGHAAFTAMRARGAKSTDIVVLVVAADDGVMPQTEEAVQHARAAGVPLVVAINKMDKPDATPDKVRTDLLQHEVMVEKMSGEVQDVEVSAISGMGLDDLLEAIALQAEILELTANPDRAAQGAVIEAQLDVGRGPVATVLVQKGTLNQGDIFVVGEQWGKVRALINDKGERIKTAGPSVPVEVLGINGTPEAGDVLNVVETEAQAREIADYRANLAKEKRAAAGAATTLEQLMAKAKEDENISELPVLVKADVQGSAEAIVQAMDKIGNEEVRVRVLHSGVGAITESDIGLAEASGAPVIGFNVRANAPARNSANQKGVEIRYYSVIYDLVDDVKAAASGLLSAEIRENFIGYAQIKEVFKVSGVGRVAGCLITEGVARRSAGVRLLRDNVVIHEGTLKTLKRFKDEVPEVQSGQECGMAFENYEDIRANDVIEIFERQEIERVLS